MAWSGRYGTHHVLISTSYTVISYNSHLCPCLPVASSILALVASTASLAWFENPAEISASNPLFRKRTMAQVEHHGNMAYGDQACLNLARAFINEVDVPDVIVPFSPLPHLHLVSRTSAYGEM